MSLSSSSMSSRGAGVRVALSMVPPANDVSGDIVVEQVESTYDGGGNLVLSVTRQRFADVEWGGGAPGPSGPLGDVNTAPQARVSWQGSWCDGIGRVRVSADYGTNGGAALVLPGVAPVRSARVLVSSNRYGADGQPAASIDALGVETRWVNDALGRRIKLLEHCTSKESMAHGGGGKGGKEDGRDVQAQRITEYGYTPDGQPAHLVLRNAQTGDQVTRWVYGSSLADSAVARTDLLRAKIYPGSDDGGLPLSDGVDGVYERLEYGYNAQGQVTQMKDPNGTVHAYDYDELGRLLHDRVTALGSGVDGTVLRLSRSYEVRGMLTRIGSYDSATVGSGSVLNEVQQLYDAAGNLATDRQSAVGAVDPGVSPEVGYGYAGGARNLASRLVSLSVTQSGSVLREYDYGYAGTRGDGYLGRVSTIDIAGEGTRVAYTYMGQARVVTVDYAQPGDLTLSYINPGSQPLGDAGDPYNGYDRFGRTVDLPWVQEDVPVTLDRFQYGYDAVGNRKWKRQLMAATGGQDEYYGYDGLYQVTGAALGNMNLNGTAIGAVPVQAESFGYDPTGNWEDYQRWENGSSVLAQERTHNMDNQMVQINGSAVGIGYDLAGNATALPPTGDGSWDNFYPLVWDAWNRLVAVKSADWSTTLATYGYDGLSRRLSRTVGGVGRQCLYNSQWKPVLEWNPAEPGTTRRLYLWGAQYRDELVLRDRDVEGSLDERLYVTHDYFHPTAITDASGTVQERYGYSAFGLRRIMAADFSPREASLYDWDVAFQGQFLDPESGFYNYGYRYYSPALGRWLNRDPIAEQGGVNLYGFAYNTPNNLVDELGLQPTFTQFANSICDKIQTVPQGFAVSQSDKAVAIKWALHWLAVRAWCATNTSVPIDREWAGNLCSKDCCTTGGQSTEFRYTAYRGGGDYASPFAGPCPKGYTSVGNFHSHPGPLAGWASGYGDKNGAADWAPYYNPSKYNFGRSGAANRQGVSPSQYPAAEDTRTVGTMTLNVPDTPTVQTMNPSKNPNLIVPFFPGPPKPLFSPYDCADTF